MNAWQLVHLDALIARTRGSASVQIGLIDGPVLTEHPALEKAHLRQVGASNNASCARPDSAECSHGTMIAGLLAADRASSAPGICPGCTLLIRPIFIEPPAGEDLAPSATPDALAAALVECIDAGPHVINLSLGLSHPTISGERRLEEALHYAARRSVIVIAAAGNQSAIGGSAITRHPWVISVAACDLDGGLMPHANIGHGIGRRGLRAPGDGLTGINTTGDPIAFKGSSVATAVVTGTVALIFSAFPQVAPVALKAAVTQSATARRNSVIPPLLDAESAYFVLHKAGWNPAEAG